MDELRSQFEVNVFGQFAVTKSFLPLIRQGSGRIVTIGSVGAHIVIPFGGVLCACKSALEALTDALRLELHASGTHVSIIEPGSILTPAIDKTLGHVEDTIADLPADGQARYAGALRGFNQRAREREAHGSSPRVVAEAVLEALTTDRPRARYPVGKDSRALATLPRVLPDRLLDRLRYRLFGLPAQFGVGRV
jgi:NAD(P)-dependent dehydrogenase (short-subunit alcohol dehydrogenase family)